MDLLAEQTRVVGRRFLLNLNLRDLPLYYRQLIPPPAGKSTRLACQAQSRIQLFSFSLT